MPKTKRILFLLSRFLDGGIDMVLLDYLRNLSACGDYRITLAIATGMGELEVFRRQVPPTVEVVHLVDDGWLTRWRKQKVKGDLPPYVKVCDELLLAPIRRWLTFRRLRTLVKKHDVVVDFDCCHYSYLQGLPVWKVAWWHFSIGQRMETDHRRMQHVGQHLSVYDRVVVISRAMLEEGRRFFPEIEGRWRLIYNAKDAQLLEQQAAQPVDDERISKPYILAVERLEESQKDLTTLIRAYRLLKSEHGVTEKLYLLGQGRDEQRLRALAFTEGVADDVEFLGFHSNPYPWIQHARLIAHSAKLEGLPTAMIESLVLGKLIVSSDCPTGPREILNDGKSGLLVPVGDVEQMAAAMYRLLTDEPLRTTILQDGEVHRRRFLFESTRQQFDEVITPS